MKGFKLGDIEIFWLNGGEFELDGGTMFGVVPKVLWAKKYPKNEENPHAIEENYIKLLNSPLLVRAPDAVVIIDTGLGNKLTEKQKQIFRVTREWDVPGDLKKLGMKRTDITHVVLTHCDFDHAGGIVMYNPAGKAELTFPSAAHIIQKSEWEDVLHPNIRSENTYWEQNFTELKESENLQIIEGDYSVSPGIELIHTGGHTRGHQIVRMKSGGKTAYHLADLLPTHVHSNPLWVMAYDNFPMEVIALKEKFLTRGVRENAWFTFYHDPSMFVCKFNTQGRVAKSVDLGEVGKPPKAAKLPTQTLNVSRDNQIVLSCPSCLLVREVSVGKYAGKKHFLTVNCPCGTTYGVQLNFRKQYRKKVSIGGYFFSEDENIGMSESGDTPTVPINCRIRNISMGGIGFTALNDIRAQVGDHLNVKFTLDKEPPQVIEKEVIVRSIQDNYIGCQFMEESGYTDRTLGFYLMK